MNLPPERSMTIAQSLSDTLLNNNNQLLNPSQKANRERPDPVIEYLYTSKAFKLVSYLLALEIIAFMTVITVLGSGIFIWNDRVYMLRVITLYEVPVATAVNILFVFCSRRLR
jgi:hypothetical protein